MKIIKLFILISLINLTISCSRNNSIALNSIQRSYYSSRDSIILENTYGSIYITRDTTFNHYDWLIPKVSNTENYTFLLKDFKKNNCTIKHFNYTLPEKWTEIHTLKNKYCVYSPSDWMSYEGIFLTDSILYHVKGVDPEIELINGFEQLNETTFDCKLSTIFINDSVIIKNTSLQIEIINPKQMICKWTWKLENGEVFKKQLFVDSRNVKLFPMVVEDCGNQKCIFSNRFQFDAIK